MLCEASASPHSNCIVTAKGTTGPVPVGAGRREGVWVEGAYSGLERIMPFEVFISHSLKDKATAEAVCAKLEAAKVRCWIAPRDISPGADWVLRGRLFPLVKN